MYNNIYGKQGGSRSTRKNVTKNINTVNLGLPYSPPANESKDASKQSESGQYAGQYNVSTFNSGATFNMASSTVNLMRIAQHRRKEKLSSESFQESTSSSSLASSYHQYTTTKNKPTNYTTINMLGSYNKSAQSKSVSPVEQTEQYAWKSNETSRTASNKQVFLPGDRVIFAESASAPGIPIIYRLEEERQSNPDKLNLDRRKLAVCPILEGEENLRLLNFQHNSIRKIEHMSMLKKLIFLDLYDNSIDEISGLSSLRLLRVLMLGKNRIKKINNLQELEMLDVLDLHGNKISKIENLSHLHQLRVLNLAGNEIKVVRNLSSLTSLTELNLRRNYIHILHDIDALTCLQRLFLSFNSINSFEDISCLSRCSSLVELSLDGNPLASLLSYKQIMLHTVSSVRLLDSKRVTEEEKRIASVMTRKEEERRKENDRLNSIKEKRRLAINNAQRQWDLQQTADRSDRNQSTMEGEHTRSPSPSSSRKSPSKSSTKDYSVCHLAELDHDSLNLYGSGSLDALDKNWGDKTCEAITTVTFRYIKFNEIVPYLKKLNSRFNSLEKLHFDLTNISCMNDINALACLEGLQHLVITKEGNPLTKHTLWKSYTVYRMSHVKLKSLNGVEITDDDVAKAEHLFGGLSTISTLLPASRLSLLTTNINDEGKSNKRCLVYHNTARKDKMELAERKSFSSNYIREIVQNSIMTDRKQTAFDTIWPQIFNEFLVKSVDDMQDIDAYCSTSLERIKKSVVTS